MRSFIIRFFILLGLIFPTVASAVTPMNLTTGWNLLGNSNAASIDVASVERLEAERLIQVEWLR